MSHIRELLKYYLRWNSLWALLSLSTASIAIISVVVVSILVSNYYRNYQNSITGRNNVQVVSSIADSTESFLNDMMSVAENVSMLVDESLFPAIRFERAFVRNDTNSIAVFDIDANVIAKIDNRVIHNAEQILAQDWFQSAKNGNTVISSPHAQMIYRGSHPWVISLSKPILWKDEYGKKKDGVLLIDMNFNKIRQLCSGELGQDGYIFVVNFNEEIIYHPRQQAIYSGIFHDESIDYVSDLPEGESTMTLNGSSVSVSVKTLSNADWRIVGIIPLRSFFSDNKEVARVFIFIIVSSALIIIVLSILISIFITKPLRRLMTLMKDVDVENFTEVSETKGVYEINELSSSFNSMIKRIVSLMERVHTEETELRRIELKLLQSQLNPHFLYNTLDSIVWMAEAGNNKNVVKMIASLASFFRLSLSGGNDMIPVENELKHAEYYLSIQKIRYSEQFDYSIETSDDIASLMTLKNVIQPIAENAVVHSVSKMPSGGYITIKASVDDNKLKFTVRDNGFGIHPDLLPDMLKPKPHSKSGLGIPNANERIQLMFGKEYGLVFESDMDEGTTVTIVLPVITNL